jgi:hypothetical protein
MWLVVGSRGQARRPQTNGIVFVVVVVAVVVVVVAQLEEDRRSNWCSIRRRTKDQRAGRKEMTSDTMKHEDPFGKYSTTVPWELGLLFSQVCRWCATPWSHDRSRRHGRHGRMGLDPTGVAMGLMKAVQRSGPRC